MSSDSPRTAACGCKPYSPCPIHERAATPAASGDDCLMPSACGVTGFYCANSRALSVEWRRTPSGNLSIGLGQSAATPVASGDHEHEWTREYAPNYRQASEANDWRETCACGATRTGTDAPAASGDALREDAEMHRYRITLANGEVLRLMTIYGITMAAQRAESARNHRVVAIEDEGDARHPLPSQEEIDAKTQNLIARLQQPDSREGA